VTADDMMDRHTPVHASREKRRRGIIGIVSSRNMVVNIEAA